MQELMRLLGDAVGGVEMYVDENQVMFRLGDIELISRLIEGQFPAYRSILPDKAETSFEIDVAEFTRITKVASLFARESAGSVKLEVRAEGEINVMSSDSEVGGNTSSAVCDVAGDDAMVALNARYLTDALGVMRAPRVVFATSGKDKACVFRRWRNAATTICTLSCRLERNLGRRRHQSRAGEFPVVERSSLSRIRCDAGGAKRQWQD
jgi:DNA polymerase-3 subunit beta